MEKQKKTWNKIIGENIRRLRISHNETQAELGESIGYGSTTIANYESGERLPDLITAYIYGDDTSAGSMVHSVWNISYAPVLYGNTEATG